MYKKFLANSLLGLSAVFVAAGIDDSIALTEKGEAYSWGFSSEYRTGQGTQDNVEVPTQIRNTALAGKKITFAGCGSQFGVLTGPALSNNSKHSLNRPNFPTSKSSRKTILIGV